jgi:hypothetical protein
MSTKEEMMTKEVGVGVVYDVTKEELVKQLQAAIKEFFVGTCEAQDDALVLRLVNGQSFCISVTEA